jgi:peptidyl-prolyl cis-trans isomerase SurA
MAPSEFEGRHIVFRKPQLPPGLPEEEKAAQEEALRAKAEKVLQEALGGADFAELARTHSEDAATKDKGGDLGKQRVPSRYGPEFDEAIGAMEEGDIHGLVESRLGFHIVQLGKKTLSPTVSHILFSTQFHLVRERKVRPVLEKEAKEKIQGLLTELEGGADFASLAGSHSDDASTKESGGEIPDYRPQMFGSEFHTALMEMKEGDPPRVVESRRGVHLVELVGIQETRFDEVREELVETWRKQRPVRPNEIQAYQEKLREEAEVVIPETG